MSNRLTCQECNAEARLVDGVLARSCSHTGAVTAHLSAVMTGDGGVSGAASFVPCTCGIGIVRHLAALLKGEAVTDCPCSISLAVEILRIQKETQAQTQTQTQETQKEETHGNPR